MLLLLALLLPFLLLLLPMLLPMLMLMLLCFCLSYYATPPDETRRLAAVTRASQGGQSRSGRGADSTTPTNYNCYLRLQDLRLMTRVQRVWPKHRLNHDHRSGLLATIASSTTTPRLQFRTSSCSINFYAGPENDSVVTRGDSSLYVV